MPWDFELVPDLFTHFDFVSPSFGLSDESPDRWPQFKQKIAELQSSAPPGTAVKVIFLARHGQGQHNMGEIKYGHRAWVEKWGRLTTDGELVFGPDPLLTPVGEQQARDVAQRWQDQIAQGMPSPTSFYTSSLTRAVRTLELTYSPTGALDAAPRPPLITDALREGVNILHDRDWGFGVKPWYTEIADRVYFTDNQRSPKTVLAERFPGWTFDADFTETDEMWAGNYTETISEHTERTRNVFDRIFEQDDATYVAISAHGGTCVTAMHILGLPLSIPPTCAVLPLVVRGVRKKD